jgi:hypothetical protein
MAIQKPNKARPTSAFVSVRITRAQYEELQKLGGVIAPWDRERNCPKRHRWFYRM